MFDKILVPIDGSNQSVEAARMAISIAGQYGSQVHLLHVISPPTFDLPVLHEPPPVLTGAALEEWEKMGRSVLERVSQEVQVANVKPTIELTWGNPVRVICDTAREGGYDLIVIGSRGVGGLTGLLLGSVSERVSHLAPCPVLIARPKKHSSGRK